MLKSTLLHYIIQGGSHAYACVWIQTKMKRLANSLGKITSPLQGS